MATIIEVLKTKTISGEFDYNLLLSCLSKYKRPRDQITKLIKNNYILPIKKGLYIFGPKAYGKIYSLEILANQIYGPSYISKEYALSYYGMIPEKVIMITSITNKRNKYFSTPIGNFSYQYLATEKYQVAITQAQINKTTNFLIATKEKALIDKIWKIKNIKSSTDLYNLLVKDLRIEEEELVKLNIKKIQTIQKYFQKNIIHLLIKLIQEL